jgi:hypothetical protein
MSFTRFHDDPSRIKKQSEELSFQGRYFLNTPGQGMDLPFEEDPHLRLQGWGANLHTNVVGLESDLYGLTRPLNRDLLTKNNYMNTKVKASAKKYRNANPKTEESRASHPSWMYRGIEQPRWETPYLNPQNSLEKQFSHNIQTRILEKDNFVPSVPVVGNNHYYLTGHSMCTGNNNCLNSQFI